MGTPPLLRFQIYLPIIALHYIDLLRVTTSQNMQTCRWQICVKNVKFCVRNVEFCVRNVKFCVRNVKFCVTMCASVAPCCSSIVTIMTYRGAKCENTMETEWTTWVTVETWGEKDAVEIYRRMLIAPWALLNVSLMVESVRRRRRSKIIQRRSKF